MMKSPSKKSRAWACLSYLGILIIFPLMSKQDDSFVLYHSRQGIVLIFAVVILGVIGRIFFETRFHLIALIILFITLTYMIIGVLNSIRGKENPLPLIGKLSTKVQL